jgi:hypothetical protein
MIQYIMESVKNNIVMLGAAMVVSGTTVALALKQHLVSAT